VVGAVEHVVEVVRSEGERGVGAHQPDLPDLTPGFASVDGVEDPVRPDEPQVVLAGRICDQALDLGGRVRSQPNAVERIVRVMRARLQCGRRGRPCSFATLPSGCVGELNVGHEGPWVRRSLTVTLPRSASEGGEASWLDLLSLLIVMIASAGMTSAGLEVTRALLGAMRDAFEVPSEFFEVTIARLEVPSASLEMPRASLEGTRGAVGVTRAAFVEPRAALDEPRAALGMPWEALEALTPAPGSCEARAKG
jgi:hypothetical protein